MNKNKILGKKKQNLRMWRAQSSGPYSTSFYLLCLQMGKVSKTKACKWVLLFCTDLSFLFFLKNQYEKMGRVIEPDLHKLRNYQLSFACVNFCFLIIWLVLVWVMNEDYLNLQHEMSSGFSSFHCPILSSLGFRLSTVALGAILFLSFINRISPKLALFKSLLTSHKRCW